MTDILAGIRAVADLLIIAALIPLLPAVWRWALSGEIHDEEPDHLSQEDTIDG